MFKLQFFLYQRVSQMLNKFLLYFDYSLREILFQSNLKRIFYNIVRCTLIKHVYIGAPKEKISQLRSSDPCGHLIANVTKKRKIQSLLLKKADGVLVEVPMKSQLKVMIESTTKNKNRLVHTLWTRCIHTIFLAGKISQRNLSK